MKSRRAALFLTTCLAVAGTAATAGCSQGPQPTGAPPAPTSAAPSTVPGSPSPTPPSTPTGQSPGRSAEPSKYSPQHLELRAGETAHLAHFDVTMLAFAYGKDGVSAGWKVRVCFTHPHPAQNPDGTTRVSLDPWSVHVRDGESATPGKWVPAGSLERDHAWSPEYATTNLSLGKCNEGWIGVRHGNPDLIFDAIKYAPADFGDEVSWKHR